MNYFKSYSKALQTKSYSSARKWVNKTGLNRVIFSILLLIIGAITFLVEYEFVGPVTIEEGPIDSNLSQTTDLIQYLDFLALVIIGLNGIAWAISEFRYNIIFVTEIILATAYMAVYHSNFLFNAANIPYTLVITGFIILILPREYRSKSQHLYNSHNKRNRRSSRRSTHDKLNIKTTDPENS